MRGCEQGDLGADSLWFTRDPAVRPGESREGREVPVRTR